MSTYELYMWITTEQDYHWYYIVWLVTSMSIAS